MNAIDTDVAYWQKNGVFTICTDCLLVFVKCQKVDLLLTRNMQVTKCWYSVLYER